MRRFPAAVAWAFLFACAVGPVSMYGTVFEPRFDERLPFHTPGSSMSYVDVARYSAPLPLDDHSARTALSGGRWLDAPTTATEFSDLASSNSSLLRVSSQGDTFDLDNS